MRDKAYRLTVVALIAVVCMSAALLRHKAEPRIIYVEVECNKLHSIEEIQEQIGAKIDGKLCKGWGGDPNHSESQRLWDRALNNQDAERYFK